MGFFDFVNPGGSSAVFSADRQHRYLLIRRWDDAPLLPFVLYNSSTGGADRNDPTILRCIAFAKREGCGLMLGNLHAFITPSPAILRAAIDPFGADNADYLLQLTLHAKAYDLPIICAWGMNKIINNVDDEFVTRARSHGVKLLCLGKNNNGSPKHPLYIKADQPFEAYP